MRLRGTARRLFLAFGFLLLVFGAAASLAMTGLFEVHQLLHQVKEQESGVRTALELASAVRDQYAHQAHTIILGNDTHLGFYKDARTRVTALTESIHLRSLNEEEQRFVEEIRTSSEELDVIFRERIVPAVLSANREVILKEHARAQGLVSEIQDRADKLALGFEKAMGSFEAHASAVHHTTFRWSLIVFVAATVLAGLLGLLVGRSIARPVAALEAGAARIAAGDLDTRIAVDFPDEFGRLAAEFNRMTAALKEHQTRLVESEKLAGIGRLAAGVAHEINNPLAVILGYARLLGRKANGEVAADLKVIEEESIRCQQIVEGLLEIARPSRVEAETVPLRELCDEIIERLTEAGQLSPGAVEIQGTAMARGDPAKLRQVVTNLIRNAVEAMEPGGRVQVMIQDQLPTSVTLTVLDGGPGIPDAIRDRLFEPFFTTKPHGTGLGLAVSKAIARAHGGDIFAENHTNGGAAFRLVLPAEIGREVRDG